ncbi:MAG: glycosyltransferase family 39 protein [Kiritimatiellae bacterium]|nr:glycosyltransferase family 39 protein [Kiritimatiellia bacterium]MDD5522553.1 glycosyltransferase family 39 protein [Kiritimatiellia bacterium]
MYFFDIWAKKIAAGDWLTAHSLHAYPEWTMTTAEDYFRIYPEQRPVFQKMVPPGSADRDARHELWDKWYCAPCLHQEPAYPYMVALTYRLLGPDPRYVFIWQSLLGVISILLIYFITLRLFDNFTAFIASLLAVLSGPLLIYEGILLRDSLITPSALGLVAMIILSLPERKPAWHFLTGIGFGFTLLVKAIFMPVVVIQAAFLLFRNGRLSRQSVFGMVFFIAGVALCLMPVVVRNIYVGAPPLSLCSANAFSSTFINSNAADSAPNHGYCISRHFARIMGITNGRSVPAVMETLKTHDSIASFLRLMWGKWTALWHWYEQPNNANFYYYRLHIPVLACLPITFFILSPLSIVGIIIAVRDFRRRWPLYLVWADVFGILMVGLVLARYRVPFQALLIPFAAWTIVSATDALLTKQRGFLSVILITVCAVSLWTMRPLPASRPLIRCADYSAVYSAYYSRYALAAIQNGNWNMAAKVLYSSLQYEPEIVRQMGPARPAKNREEASLAELYAQVYQRIAEALQKAGNKPEAEHHNLRSKELQSVKDQFNLQSTNSAKSIN